MTLVQFDFPYPGPYGSDMAAALTGLAESIAGEPGLHWKIWTENAGTGEAGGIYLFATREEAEAYVRKHTARLQGFGIGAVNAKLFDVNVPLGRITRAPLP